MTRPSPEIVAPENGPTPSSSVPRLLMTISSFPSSSSTTTPNGFPPPRRTTTGSRVDGGVASSPRTRSSRTRSSTCSSSRTDSRSLAVTISEGATGRITLTAVSGNARVSGPQRTIRASAMATVSGTFSGNRVALPGRQEATLHRPPAEEVRVDPAAIILDLHQDEAARLGGRERQPALRGLAETLTLIGRLDPVPDGVLDQVQERIRDLLDDAGVDLGRLASNRQGDRLPRGAGRLPHLLGDPGEEAPDRHHARPGDLLAQRRSQALDLGGILPDAPQEGRE